jgi:phenylpropionate dioxygenase-like ring-hydroxylating dioxygenase large terminal subunit
VTDLFDGGFADRRIYTDPEILQREKDLIFARTWHYACTVHDVSKPGDCYTLTVADVPVLVLAGHDGRPRACSAAYGSVPVNCETFHDLVFVALDPVVPALREYLGSFAERLGPYVDGIEPIGRNSWVYDGNWKIWHENFRDNYHPEFTHRLIHDLTPRYADAGGNWGFDEGHSVLQWAGPGASSPDRYLRSLRRYSGVRIEAMDAPVERTSRKGTPDEVLAVFPNADFQPRATADARGLKAGFIQTVTPLGVDQARVDLTVYSSIHDDQATRQQMLENVADTQGPWGKISADDTEAACRVQIGMNALGTRRNIYTRGTAPGNGGPDAQSRDEYSQRAFFKAYIRYLTLPDQR